MCFVFHLRLLDQQHSLKPLYVYVCLAIHVRFARDQGIISSVIFRPVSNIYMNYFRRQAIT